MKPNVYRALQGWPHAFTVLRPTFLFCGAAARRDYLPLSVRLVAGAVYCLVCHAVRFMPLVMTRRNFDKMEPDVIRGVPWSGY